MYRAQSFHMLWLLCCIAIAEPVRAAAPAAANRAPDPAGVSPFAQASPGTVRADPKTPYFAIDSRLAVGNKGEELLDVSVEGHCGELGWVFDHAELVLIRSRFGAAQFVSMPPAGCVACPPIVMRWYHEPTGHLAFSVNVYRRLEIVQCPLEPQPAR